MKGVLEMRTRYLVLGVLAGVSVCSMSHAASNTSGVGDGLLAPNSITVGDNTLGDWGVAVPGVANDIDAWNSTRGAYAWEDEQYRPGPGVGGQNFDAESLYTGFDASTNTLYVGLVTGFDIGGELSTYYAGDLFIDFGNDYDQTGRASNLDGSAEVAYDLVNVATRWDLAFVLGRNGVYGGNVANAGSTSVDAIGTPNFTHANSPQGNPGFPSGPLSVTSGTNYGNADFSYTDNWGGGDHNIYEFSYQLTGLQGQVWQNQLALGGWTAHWTMSCGNDFLDVGANLPPGTPLDPVVPVPAAAPLGLLGMGLVGILRKKRQAKS